MNEMVTLPRAILTADQAREWLSYDPDTGLIYRRKPAGPLPAGSLAGGVTHSGYIRVVVCGHKVFAHRLAWLMTYGRMPTGQIDHINRIRTDNRLSNLREVNQAANAQNVGISIRNTTGYKGVSFHKVTGKYRASIKHNGTYTYLGIFESAEAASFAYQEAAKNLHSLNPAVSAHQGTR